MPVATARPPAAGPRLRGRRPNAARAAAEARSHESVVERRQLERQLIQSGKLATLGKLAAGVAHEIENPLVAILGLVDCLLKNSKPGTQRTCSSSRRHSFTCGGS
jgi:C4-dicarboxylate-specific signal transduction histidine kinase